MLEFEAVSYVLGCENVTLLCFVYLFIHTEEHAGLCVCGGRPGDVAHHESAAESQTLLHPQAAGAQEDQLRTK